MADEVQQAELVAFRSLRQQEGPRVDPVKVMAVPVAMIVSFGGPRRGVPPGKAIIKHKIQLEVNMGAFAGDSLPGVGGAAQDADLLTGPDRLPGLQPRPDFPQ